ncbi:MAG: hypothetical protein ACE37B_08150 [Ilumatobacter sp.]|uniref:F0F1 ATP synthase subunit B family protein n=1 Tax=Ilumatobacter sp. TaxID=1967498 RepID=UPI00391B8389
MLTAVVTTRASGQFEIAITGSLEVEDGEEEAVCERTDLNGELQTDPANCPELNPIAPEVKEMAWGFGAFVILALCLRYWLFPKVRDGMTARYESIESDRESAQTLTAAARADVAEYEARLASVRHEAQQKVDAARATLEKERSERLAEANARIAAKRAEVAAEVEAARQAAMGDVESAVSDVVGRAVEIATGKPADPSVVQTSVRSTMGAGATS